ncbi:MAG: hypothetical protein ND807_07175, partial [Vicinamibacterales bacterium]|nr:hypothetical protein [Vicinamibacterales bacterium]
MSNSAPNKALDAHALQWLRGRLQLACDVSETIAILRRQGWSENAIIGGFEAVRPRGNALANGAMQSPPLIRRA